MADQEATMKFTEVREQILANAIHLFPTIVEDYLNKHHIIQAKPKQIFDIIVVKVDGSSFEDWDRQHETWAAYDCNENLKAHLIYGDLTSRKVALAALPQSSRYEAFTKLLDATESALAILDDGLTFPDETKVKAAIWDGKYLVDLKLMMESGKRVTCDFRSGLTSGQPGY